MKIYPDDIFRCVAETRIQFGKGIVGKSARDFPTIIPIRRFEELILPHHRSAAIITGVGS